MTARISRDFEFQCCVHFRDQFFINLYKATVDFLVESDSIREQNIALERIKYFLTYCIEGSVFINLTENSAIEKYTEASMKACTLPEDPYDQIIAIMLVTKFNAITEGRLLATHITIKSRMSDDVSFMYDIEESAGPFQESNWWNDNSTKISEVLSNKKNKKILKAINPNIPWDEVYLTWEEPNESTKSTPTAEILFGSFDNKKR